MGRVTDAQSERLPGVDDRPSDDRLDPVAGRGLDGCLPLDLADEEQLGDVAVGAEVAEPAEGGVVAGVQQPAGPSSVGSERPSERDRVDARKQRFGRQADYRSARSPTVGGGPPRAPPGW